MALTRHEGVVDDLKEQSELFPQHGEHLFSPRQQRRTPATELLHRSPLGTNNRGHFFTYWADNNILTYSGIPRQKTDFAYLSVTDVRRWDVASFSGK